MRKGQDSARVQSLDSYLDLPDPSQFVAACRERGLTTVCLAWQREWGQVPDQAIVDYTRLARCTLLAYRAGVILRCLVVGDEADPATLRRRLAEAGLTVEERSRNTM
jgi:hypothetical protein